MEKLIAVRKYACLAVVTALAALGFFTVLCATPQSVVLDSDSICFIDAARHLSNGFGLTYGGQGVARPLLHWPPLYPGLLGVLGVYGPDPIVSARWVGASFFAADILLVGVLLLIYTAGSFWIPVLGSALTLASLSLLTCHTVVWTEQPFLFLALLGLAALAAHLQKPCWRLLILAIIFLGFAILARYVGFVLIATGVACLLIWARQSLRARVRDAAIFAAGSAVPIGLWMIRNLQYGGSATNRRFSFHPIEPQEFTRMFWTFAHWIFPPIIPTDLWAVYLAIAGVALAGLVILAARKRKDDSEAATPDGREEKSELALLPHVLTAFAVMYVAFLIVSISFFDIATPMSDRILLPVCLSGLVVIPCLLFRVIQKTPIQRRTYVTAGILLLGAVALNANVRQTVEWIDRVGWRGVGVESLARVPGGIVALVKALPDNPILYTNGGAALSFLSGSARTRSLPQKRIPHSGSPMIEDPTYPRTLHAMAAAMRKDNAKLVFMYFYAFREQFATIDELKSDLPLCLLASAEDGAIYEWDPAGAKAREANSSESGQAPQTERAK